MRYPKAGRLKGEGRTATSGLERALAAQQRFADQAVRLCEQLEGELAAQASALSGDSGLHDSDLLAWLCSDIRAEEVSWHSGMVGTSGSGPWQIDEFDSFLQGLGFELAHVPHQDLRCVVLGTEGWDEDELSDQIYDRDGSELIILSQPLFVAGLLKNANPLASLDRATLLAIADKHPALSFVMNHGFEWVFDEKSRRVTVWETTRELAEKSPLGSAGYSVAIRGPSEDVRRGILREFFLDPAPDGVRTSAERKRWGSAKSAQRLYGIASFLDWLCRYQGSNAPEAVDRWRGDLAWLKREFYRPTMQFQWPSPPEPRRSEPAVWRGSPSKPQTTLNPVAAWPFPTKATR